MDGTAVKMASGRTPLALINNLKTTTFLITTPSRTTSDTIINRSSEATAHTPSTTTTSFSSTNLVPRIKHTTSESSLQSDGQQSPDIIMAHTSTRHSNSNQSLEIGQRSSPPKPSAWHESVHRDQLVKVFDAIVEVTARNPKYPKCTTSQVNSTLNAMLKRCPELGQGRVPLTRDWIEYVLGKALRSPFCSAAMMGRWEILASSGGARGMWGPW